MSFAEMDPLRHLSFANSAPWAQKEAKKLLDNDPERFKLCDPCSGKGCGHCLKLGVVDR